MNSLKKELKRDMCKCCRSCLKVFHFKTVKVLCIKPDKQLISKLVLAAEKKQRKCLLMGSYLQLHTRRSIAGFSLQLERYIKDSRVDMGTVLKLGLFNQVIDVNLQ
ncbi:hypothetical protein ISN45_At03g018990 [Arabidopsis thaliana x Arabidopsis arenosa]|uniref:Uncharacterized protein n=3 Tax=Arabidopsis TaxID=3701 RepID=A0A5S9XD96_ARATH|nr:hypothetical protein ISN45_At03g018990 [Arabidopsis thaliana x Arabidopsis arenosa]KAG7631686.1 hypothetical protein ISN44_As03g018950 [Arabidopsis suecica]CAA0382840.1 unnamed protein product [Arabidopsis thaliana]